jgi:hypothetical protein
VEILGEGVKKRVEEVRRRTRSRHLVLGSEEGDAEEVVDEVGSMGKRRPHSWASTADSRNKWESVRDNVSASNRHPQIRQPGLSSPTRRITPTIPNSSSPPRLPLRPPPIPLREKKSLILDREPHWSPPLYIPPPSGISPPIPPGYVHQYPMDGEEPIWYPPTPAASRMSHPSSSIPTQFRPSFTPTLPTSFTMDFSTPPHTNIHSPLPHLHPPGPPQIQHNHSASQSHPTSQPPIPPPHASPRSPPPIRSQTPLSPKSTPSLSSSNIRTPPAYTTNHNTVRPTIRLVPRETKEQIAKRGRAAISSRWTESLLQRKREWSKGVEIVTKKGTIWRTADAVLGNIKYEGKRKRVVGRDRSWGDGEDTRGNWDNSGEMEMGGRMAGMGTPGVSSPGSPPQERPRAPPIPAEYLAMIAKWTTRNHYPSPATDPIPPPFPHQPYLPHAPPPQPYSQQFTAHLPGPFAEPSQPNSRTASPIRPSGTAVTDDSTLSRFSDLMRSDREYKMSPSKKRVGFGPPSSYARAKVSASMFVQEPISGIPAEGHGYYTAYQI